MQACTVRVAIEYDSVRKPIVFNFGANEEELIKGSLELFGISIQDHNDYKLIILSLNCRATDSNCLLNNEILLLKNINCDCGDHIFLGVACRHLLALVSKEKDLAPDTLPMNERWKIDYYVEEIKEFDEFSVEDSENSSDFHVQRPNVENPEEIIGPGRPLSREQRIKGPQEKRKNSKRKYKEPQESKQRLENKRRPKSQLSRSDKKKIKRS